MRLTNNFWLSEFACKDGTPVPDNLIETVLELAENLQVLRDALGEPIHINSGYRTEKHNKRIGGVKNSYHVKAMASDISVRNRTPKQVARKIKKLIAQGKMKKGGIGLYNGFVHYDIRGYNAKWDNSSLFNF